MSTKKTAKIWNACDKGVNFDSGEHRLKIMECFLREMRAEKGLYFGNDEGVPMFYHDVIDDCVQEIVIPALRQQIDEGKEPVDTTEVGIRIQELQAVVKLLEVEFYEMLGIYRNLSTSETELQVNGQKVNFEIIETLTRGLAETMMPRMIERIAGKLSKMLDCAINERNESIEPL